MRSREILDYVEVEFDVFRPDRAVLFDVFLYFVQNNHLMLWLKNGELVRRSFIDKYRDRGLKNVWIHKEDRELFEQYIVDQVIPITHPDEIAEAAPIDLEQALMAKTEEGAYLSEVLNSNELSDFQKQKIAAALAQDVLEEAAAAKNNESQDKLNRRAREIVQDILVNDSEIDPAISDIWKIANLDSRLEHGVNVATQAVLYALAFGRIDQKLLSDIALSGLLHDVGLSQLNAIVTSKSILEVTEMDKIELSKHVEHSVRLIKQYAPDIPERVLEIILQHHEQFDGKGYPNKRVEHEFDDLAQLTSIADMMVSVSSGQYDQKRHTFSQTVTIVEELQNVGDVSRHFNPDIFNQVMTWIHSPEAKKDIDEAASQVKKEIKRVVG